MPHSEQPVVEDMRRSYEAGAIDPESLDPDPIAQFAVWFGDAAQASIDEPNAMTLATIGPDGFPAARVVLLKAFDSAGFVFFTNADSAKGRDLARSPRAALVFFWPPLERQVRVEGSASRVPDDVADAYFAKRPRASQLGAWASPQSEIVPSRESLDLRFAEAERRFPGQVPRPPAWGGFRVEPARIEFWQGRTGRLHDRVEYVRAPEGWRRQRLAP